ncbi:MAG: phage tail tube protein [Candidatus Pacebacteria bacterium]|nr:phage tail tube protein [Candidatus Paceibacterota bacterium]
MPQITAKGTITLAGKVINNKEGEFDLDIGSPERKMVKGANGPVGHTETPTTPFVEFTAYDTSQTSLDELGKMVDVTLSIRTDTGKSYVMTNAVSAKPVGMKKGEIALRFEAMKCNEVK